MTPEEQYVQCMDDAYAASDRETYFKMMRQAEGALRGEFVKKQSFDGSADENLAA